jgi:(R,R)-butanediol dehydrogenase/meso-butanediol dehydrogenase/diacetyl reductase
LVARETGAIPVELEAEEIFAATGGKPIASAIEATGVNAVLERLVLLVGPAAKIALVGIPGGAATLSTIAIVERELELKGCSAFRDELPEAVGLLSDLIAPLGRLIEAPIGLDAVPEAYRRLIAGGGTGLKTIVRP